jgi:hypothetical protein
MKTRTVIFLAALALALGACATAESTPQIVYVEVTATPVPSTPTPAPTATPARLTNDVDCQANWLALGDDPAIGREVLGYAIAHPEEFLPGSTAEYLIWCVDEGWRGYFDN